MGVGIKDEKGLGYLNRIHEASVRMGILIEALLQLSKVTRSEMMVTEVNLSQMAAEVIADLFSERLDVSWKIEPGLKCLADPTLIQVVLVNLLGNAYKYTSRQEKPCIEFAKMVNCGHTCFYVRDNGVGFDMLETDKLFEAFHRLHADFEGTGIGLALVQRIIHRHGGKIWVEAEMGKGATFYFYV